MAALTRLPSPSIFPKRNCGAESSASETPSKSGEFLSIHDSIAADIEFTTEQSILGNSVIYTFVILSEAKDLCTCRPVAQILRGKERRSG
jgi:hypothetical protein